MTTHPHPVRVGALLLVSWSGVACGQPSAPTVPVTVRGHTLQVEIADDGAERARGLMYRDSLPAEQGMLFVYPDDQERSFWMKDTRIPLSIAYLDATGRIVHIADMRPLDRAPVPSGAPARYALEVNVGWFAAHGVQEGDVVSGLDKLPTPK